MTRPAPLYIKEADVARLLGHDVTWLRANASALETITGFPKVDVVIGMRHREAIEEWARERNFRKAMRQERLTETNRENPNAF